MNENHTPGRWEVRGPYDVKSGGRCLSVEAPNGLTVATVGYNEGDDLAACRADADLIAAAPDMLAALEALIDAGPGAEDWEAACNAVDRARGRLKGVTP